MQERVCCFISSQQKVGESHSPRGTWRHITSAPAQPCDKPTLPVAVAWGQRTGLLCMVTGPSGLGEGGTLLCHSGTRAGWPAAPVSQAPRPPSSSTPGPSHGLTACPHGAVCKLSRAANDSRGHHRPAVLPSFCQPGHHPDCHPNNQKYTAASKPSHVAQHSHPRAPADLAHLPLQLWMGFPPQPLYWKQVPPHPIQPGGLPAKTHQISQAPQETDPQRVTAQKPLEPGVLVQKAWREPAGLPPPMVVSLRTGLRVHPFPQGAQKQPHSPPGLLHPTAPILMTSPTWAAALHVTSQARVIGWFWRQPHGVVGGHPKVTTESLTTGGGYSGDGQEGIVIQAQSLKSTCVTSPPVKRVPTCPAISPLCSRWVTEGHLSPRPHPP